MKNPATNIERDELNEFTRLLADRWLNSSDKTFVRLRNNTIVQPIFTKAEDQYCHDAFYTEDYSMCWNLDGTSVTNMYLDMMEIL